MRLPKEGAFDIHTEILSHSSYTNAIPRRWWILRGEKSRGGGARGLRGQAGRERRRRAGAVKGERVEQSGAERRERSSERASDNLLVCTWGPAPTAVRQCVRPFRDQIISPEIVLSMELFPHDIKYLTILMPLSAQKEEQ